LGKTRAEKKVISDRHQSTANARTRSAPGVLTLAGLLLPAVGVVLLLFGGGLILGFFQSLGYLPAAGMNFYTLAHFENILFDPDFFLSLGLTLYVSLTSTIMAAALSVGMALAMVSFKRTRRIVDFVFQIPLTVPHLVIATAVVFLLAPTGMISRAMQALGLIDSSSAFPLMINDSFGIGIIVTYIWKEIPFITLMILSVLKNLGPDLLAVGRTLNANRWQRFRYIILPTIFPSLGAACLIVFAFTFGAFEVPYLLGQTYPMTLPVWAYRNYSDVDLMARPEGIATGIIIAAVVIFSIVLSQILTQIARRRGVII
jgi:putative spermidine/putrescine transport system permease protein